MKGNTKLMMVTAFAMISLLAMSILTLSLQVKAQRNQTYPNCPPGKIPKTNSNGVPLIDPDTHMPICVTNGKLPVPPPRGP